MRLHAVEISNVKGISFLRFEPNTITILAGANGTGKTSVLDAIRMIFDGGSDPGWLRDGQKKGHCRLDLDDGAVILKSLTPKGSRLEITDEHGNPVSAPQAYVNELAEALAVDPAKLLNPALKPTEIARALLEAMPIEFSTAEIKEAAADIDVGGPMDLDDFDAARKQIYERRRRANSEFETADRTVTGLTRDLGADTDEAEIESLVLAAEKAQEERRLRHVTLRQKLTGQAQDQIELIRAQLRADLDAIDAQEEPIMERVASELAVLRAQLAAKTKRDGARATIEKMRWQAREKFLEAETLTRQLEALDVLKGRKLAELPIEGLVFDGDSFSIDGTPWEHVNTARRVDVALQLAVLRAGPLKVLVLDDAEHLDPEGMVALKQGAERRGFQVIAARVTDDEQLLVQEGLKRR